MLGRVPTVTDVDRIVALDEPILRNLQITQCYHELSSALAEMTGPTANWCTFATWASKQAGQTIRREDLRETFKDILDKPPENTERVAASASEVSESAERVVKSALDTGSQRDAASIRESIRRTIRQLPAFDRASEAVERGNNKVFAEIGREFARFLATCQGDTSFDPEKITRFCDALRPGEPPEGQRYLRQAFARYYRALFEDDTKTKAELMFLANLEIGYHEQTRLQPEIQEALNAPVADSEQLERELRAAIFPHLPHWRTPLDIAYDRLVHRVRELARLVITERMMTIALPNGEPLRLGQDLRANFAQTLERIANPQLLALLDQVDPTPNSMRGSGAEDWADFHNRMHFIADMFRAYHEQRRLFDAPFTDEQVIQIKAGRTPTGAL